MNKKLANDMDCHDKDNFKKKKMQSSHGVIIIHYQPTSHGGESTLSRNVGQSFSVTLDCITSPPLNLQERQKW